MKPSFRNLFMKKLTRDRLVPKARRQQGRAAERNEGRAQSIARVQLRNAVIARTIVAMRKIISRLDEAVCS
jgi:hypothetical protein